MKQEKAGKSKNKVNYAGMGSQVNVQRSDKSGKSAYDQTMKIMTQAGNAAASKTKFR